ncbi:HDOD domain-containing protein [Vibrio sp. SCSIO 43136]|uniref:HDOD domain-containing protein n=1 Tax=Vibrio sp. SCSIO 43136 TaxID=2819101 RepID=UPI0020751854|nr:HDOD domain-containing protein [Vibrio sp. SCSIO 43136]USD64151.1 HDOD domain-containing protein [Vibrio sp. SCSIO 43136]
MNHLSFYWLPDNNQMLLKGLESEFAQLVEQSIQTGKISLPPIPEVVLKIQRLCTQETTTVMDVAECLLEDPGLAAVVIRVANSVVFNRRNITFTDINTAVSRLGIMRVRDIVTAQTVEQLKHSVNLKRECNQILMNSAKTSRHLGATMVMVTNLYRKLGSKGEFDYLEPDKALLTGLLADIGLFCLVNEYHLYLDAGNYLDYDLALQIFQSRCPVTSQLVLQQWGFDQDFIEVATNRSIDGSKSLVSYLDIAKMANHLLMFRSNDEAIDEHEVEFDVTGAEVLFELSNLSDFEFNQKVDKTLSSTGL